MRKLTPCLLYMLLLIFSCNTDDPISQDQSKLENLKQAHGEFLQHTHESDVAYALLEKVRVLAEKLNSNEYLAKYYAHYGLLKREEGDYGEAVHAYHEAFNFYGNDHDSTRQAFIKNNIGYVYRMSAMYDQALKYFKEAENLHIKLNNSDRLPGVYENIALTYMDKGDYRSSELYLKKGLDLARSYNQKKAGVLLNLYGKLHFLQEEYAKARAYYNQALALDASDTEKAYLYGNIGETYLKEGNVQQAEVWLTNAMQQKKKLENPDLRPNLNYMAELEAQKHNTNASLNYYHQVLELSSNDLYSDELEKALIALDLIYGSNTKLLISRIERYQNFRQIYTRKRQLDSELREEMKTLYYQASLKAVEDEFKHKQILQERDTKARQLNYGIAAALMVLLVGRFLFLYHKKLKKAKRERDQHLVTIHERESDVRNIEAMLKELKLSGKS